MVFYISNHSGNISHQRLIYHHPKLLQFIIDEYVSKQGHTLGLLVDEKNPNAKRLYLKLGFKHVGNKVLLGNSMKQLQINP